MKAFPPSFITKSRCTCRRHMPPIRGRRRDCRFQRACPSAFSACRCTPTSRKPIRTASSSPSAKPWKGSQLPCESADGRSFRFSRKWRKGRIDPAAPLVLVTLRWLMAQCYFRQAALRAAIRNRSLVEMAADLTHLQRLEAESIHIMREVAANFARPVMLYSVGKDSSVLLHLAMKAFYPARPPFPFLHVDTTWKFREMIAFRDRMAAELGFDLLVHINEEGVRDGINPFDHGSNVHTHIMKTVGLRQALDKYGFDA